VRERAHVLRLLRLGDRANGGRIVWNPTGGVVLAIDTDGLLIAVSHNGGEIVETLDGRPLFGRAFASKKYVIGVFDDERHFVPTS
jgi:hypothetical protein